MDPGLLLRLLWPFKLALPDASPELLGDDAITLLLLWSLIQLLSLSLNQTPRRRAFIGLLHMHEVPCLELQRVIPCLCNS
jgi:hypothetical protein